MDFSSEVQTPLSCKRKRVDNSDIEKLRMAKYDEMWRVLEGHLTKLSTVLDSRNKELFFKQKLINALKEVMIKEGNIKPIKEKEREHKSFNRNMAGNDGQVEQRRHDKNVHHQSGKSSYNVATNYEALKKEIFKFILLVTIYIEEVINFLHSCSAREEKCEKELASIMVIVEKLHEHLIVGTK